MKTEKEFEALAFDFNKAVEGKADYDFFNAVATFAHEHSFEAATICCLYKSDVDEVGFLTDHPFNDVGFIIYNKFDGVFCFFVGSKKQVKKLINGCTESNKLSKGSSPS